MTLIPCNYYGRLVVLFSFVFGGQTDEDCPSGQVANCIDGEQRPQTLCEGSILIDLSEWVTAACRVIAAPARPFACFNISCIAPGRITFIFWGAFLAIVNLFLPRVKVVVHECLVAILEDGEVLELFEVGWNIV